MWIISGENISMTEGDFGIELPITISGVTLGAGDSILFELKSEKNGDVVITEEFINIAGNTVNLVLSEMQSNLLHVGTYVYTLDWYKSGEFMCNIINGARFRVVDKA